MKDYSWIKIDPKVIETVIRNSIDFCMEINIDSPKSDCVAVVRRTDPEEVNFILFDTSNIDDFNPMTCDKFYSNYHMKLDPDYTGLLDDINDALDVLDESIVEYVWSDYDVDADIDKLCKNIRDWYHRNQDRVDKRDIFKIFYDIDKLVEHYDNYVLMISHL